jgi:hypothetical protein
MRRMQIPEELRELLAGVEDTHELVLSSVTPARASDELFVVWGAARAEANLAYDGWCAAHGLEAYAVYLAAEDRADAAEAAYAAHHPAG